MSSSSSGIGYSDLSFAGLAHVKTVEGYEFLQVNTTSSTAITSTGVNMFTVASNAYIAPDQVLAYDTGVSQEYITVMAVSGNVVTASFALTHASGAAVISKVQRQAVMVGDPNTISSLNGVTSKGLQAVTALESTDLSSCGRLLLTLVFDPAAYGSTSETAISFTQNLNYVQSTGVTSFTVPTGKTLRLQQIVIGAYSSGMVSTVQIRLRVNTSGSATTSSPLLLSERLAINTGSTNVSLLRGEMDFPAGASLLFTRVDSASNTINSAITVYGYLY